MKITGRGLTTVAACLPMVLLGACSEDSADGDESPSEATPSETGSGSPSESASASESQSASEEPSGEPTKKYPEDKPASKISAEDVARAWVAAYSDAVLSGDTTRMRRIGLSSCGACNAFIEQLNGIYGAGGEVMTSDPNLKVISDEVLSAESSQRVAIRLIVKEEPGSTVFKQGQRPKKFQGEQGPWDFTMKLQGNHWRIAAVSFP